MPQSVGTNSVQARLTIGGVQDRYEQEADRVADYVMQEGTQAEDGFSIQQVADGQTVRRTPVSPFSMAEGRLVEDEEEIQPKVDNQGAVTAGATASAKVEAAVAQSGSALPDTTRSLMESRFGYDFHRVRIHTNTPAAEAAASIGARAFTKGANIVFAGGQYAPDSSGGQWLLAHELTHVVQQGHANAVADAPAQSLQTRPQIGNDDGPPTIRRVNWGAARDTGRDSFPWGSGPRGDVYEVETDAGTKIPAWKPHDGRTYWCHGYTFGGSTAAGGPFSIWGNSVRTVLNDDGWQSAFSCVAGRGDILVFAANNVAHTGIIHSAFEPGGTIDETTSMLNSKWGQLALNRQSWAVNARQYGQYEVFSKQPAAGPCAGKGANER